MMRLSTVMAWSWITRATVVAVTVGILVSSAAIDARPSGRQAQSGATSPPPPAAETGTSSEGLDRIRKALEQEPVLDLTKERLRFYASVVAQPLSAEQILGKNFDLINGPTRGGAPMTHQEFLNMVTPKELYGSGGIRPVEMLQWSVVNIVGYALIKKAILELKDASSEAEIREIRERIDRELEAIRRAGGG